MNVQELIETARTLVADDKGLLPFRGLCSCRSANPVNWPRPV
jgi:hypothetical protein